MSHVLGTHLGGIRTLDDLRKRCRIDEDTGCWHWSLAISQGAPRVHFVTPDTGRKATMRGRRAALYLRRGKDLDPGMLAFARQVCKSADCVNPAHATSGDSKAAGRALAASGRVKGLPSKRVAATATARGRLAKITMDDAREIRVSDESTYALAKRYGIAQSAIWSIKRGLAWQEHAPNASVFTWRPGA